MTTNALDALVNRISDSDLRDEIAREVQRLRSTKDYGLVFERHRPETVRLYGSAIRRGHSVQLKNSADDSTSWSVRRVAGDEATLLAPDGSEEVRKVEELVVVQRHGDPLFPGLRRIKRIVRGGDKPFHTVINAENSHALELLYYTNANTVDVVSIDPPYNKDAGGWSYNDKYVDENDSLRDSKWLAWMERRLLVARNLLKDTGILLIHIDDVEQAPLRMLCDDLFGRENFIAQMVWNGGLKNDSTFVSVGHDYIIVYAKNKKYLKDLGIRWRERKAGLDEIYESAARIWNVHRPDSAAATSALKSWFRELPKDAPALANKQYNHMDEAGRVYFPADIAWPRGVGPRYDVLHPETGQPCKVPASGWRIPNPERMAELVSEGRIHFGADHRTVPKMKKFLSETEEKVAASVFYRDRRSADKDLESILGSKRFPNPKSVDVVAHLINLVSGSEATVVDFFGGSGTTAHAVAALNQADGGNRRAILVTNNEVTADVAKELGDAGHRPGDLEWEARGVFNFVTLPRLEAAWTGKRPDGKTPIPASTKNLSGRPMSEGLDQNIEFFELTYLDRNAVERDRAFTLVSPLLWLKCGAEGAMIEHQEGMFAAPPEAKYAVLFDVNAWSVFATRIRDRDDLRQVYIVTDSLAQFQQVAGELPKDVEVLMLYEDYLRNFEINSGGPP